MHSATTRARQVPRRPRAVAHCRDNLAVAFRQGGEQHLVNEMWRPEAPRREPHCSKGLRAQFVEHVDAARPVAEVVKMLPVARHVSNSFASVQGSHTLSLRRIQGMINNHLTKIPCSRVPGDHAHGLAVRTVRDRDGRASVGLCCTGDRNAEQHAQFADLRRRGARFVGMTSYRDFPRADPATASITKPFASLVPLFPRAATAFHADGATRARQRSDFTDWAWVERNAISAKPTYPHELVYVGAVEPWQYQAKNWPLAARCLPRLCRAFGVRALVIGKADAAFPPQPGISFHQALPWPALLATLARARLLFVPNAIDPSPRIVPRRCALTYRC